jgi:hypothetical protein
MKIEAGGRQEEGPFLAGGRADKNKTLCRLNSSATSQQAKSLPEERKGKNVQDSSMLRQRGPAGAGWAKGNTRRPAPSYFGDGQRTETLSPRTVLASPGQQMAFRISMSREHRSRGTHAPTNILVRREGFPLILPHMDVSHPESGRSTCAWPVALAATNTMGHKVTINCPVREHKRCSCQ